MSASPKDELLKAMKAAEEAVLEAQLSDQIYGVREGAPPIAPWPSGPCRLVFLDFDGVLNCDRSRQELGTKYRFARSSVAALNLVLRQTGAFIVITSSWRDSWSLRDNAEFLERDGILSGRVVGKTPTSERERGVEIDAWLRSVPYPVESFVILDDREDMGTHRKRLIRVDPEVGLGEVQARRAISLLMGQEQVR